MRKYYNVGVHHVGAHVDVPTPPAVPPRPKLGLTLPVPPPPPSPSPDITLDSPPPPPSMPPSPEGELGMEEILDVSDAEASDSAVLEMGFSYVLLSANILELE